LVVGAIDRTAKSNHDANVFGARLGGGYRFDVAGFGLRPSASFSYVLLDEESFTETGAMAANLVVGSRTTHSLVSELGLRVARAFRPEIGTFVPYLSGAWKYDFNVDDRQIVSGLSGAGGASFPLDGRHIDQSGALAGAGLIFLRDRWSASLEYLGEFRGDYQANGVFARVGMSF
jgi:outer membrane autotransporter protein